VQETARIRKLTGLRLAPTKRWEARRIAPAPASSFSAEPDEHQAEPPGFAGELRIDDSCCPPAPTDTTAKPAPRRQAVPQPGAPRSRARRLAALYALGGGMIGLAPLPFSDGPMLIALETRLTSDIGRLYDPEVARRNAARLAPLVGGAGMLLRLLSGRIRRRNGGFAALTDGLVAMGGVLLIGEGVTRWYQWRYSDDEGFE
jgi:hypothetical protein